LVPVIGVLRRVVEVSKREMLGGRSQLVYGKGSSWDEFCFGHAVFEELLMHTEVSRMHLER
jgi:hypothetical protein